MDSTTSTIEPEITVELDDTTITLPDISIVPDPETTEEINNSYF